ncbi:hypothetical protein D3C81_247080 [compost metagenome]
MSSSRLCLATFACCKRPKTPVICAIGANMREDKIEQATKAPVVISPSITAKHPTKTTIA